MSNLHEHLKQLSAMMEPRPGFQYGSIYGYFADRGVLLPSRVLPQPHMGQWKRDVMREVRKIDPKMKECFYNAQRLVLQNPGRFSYWEGYVLGACMIPVHHGWCVEHSVLGSVLGIQGAVVDPTLRIDHEQGVSAKNLVLGKIPEGWEYVGCGFSLERVKARWLTGMAGSLVDDYESEWVELRGNGDGSAARAEAQKLKAVLHEVSKLREVKP